MSAIAPSSGERLLAGHLLRRAGFGPTAGDVQAVVAAGAERWVDEQLDPASIDDRALDERLGPEPRDPYDAETRVRRWYTRMVYSRRQLQEKMTLVWHEHFATSNAKVGLALAMGRHEEMLRRNCLGSFARLLEAVTTDAAMLVWLDNDGNDGNAIDGAGDPVPPNNNYARELLQLFSTGTALLDDDGAPVLDDDGAPVAAYTEHDVEEVARALTGWDARARERRGRVRLSVRFDPARHDAGDKTIFGTRVKGRAGKAGAREVADVVEAIMRHPSVAPFVSKTLIEKLATEAPAPGYVARVSAVFRATGGDLRATVRAILLDPEFTSDAVVRSQYRTPIEQYVGAVRALGAETEGAALVDWCRAAKHLVYYPPSVFSFYPPGRRGALVSAALLFARDKASDQLVAGYYDTTFDAPAFVAANGLDTPERVVDALSEALLAAPLDPAARIEVVAYMAGTVTEEKVRGAAWLVLCSPDFQRN